MSVCGGDVSAVRLATLLMVALPGAPSIYYGDEIGLRGGLDPDCRGSFPWLEEAWDRSLRDFVRAALSLRAGEEALRGDTLRVVAADGGGCAFERAGDGSRLLVTANGADESAVLATGQDVGVAGEPLLTSGPGDVAWFDLEEGRSIRMPPRWGAIWRMA
jgi:glycosidase